MAHDDFEVVVYKLLAYMYGCIREGVEPCMHKAQEVCKCNDVYWKSILASVMQDGFISGEVFRDMNGDILDYADMTITMKGAECVKQNAAMRKAARFLGGSFAKVLQSAIRTTPYL